MRCDGCCLSPIDRLITPPLCTVDRGATVFRQRQDALTHHLSIKSKYCSYNYIATRFLFTRAVHRYRLNYEARLRLPLSSSAPLYP